MNRSSTLVAPVGAASGNMMIEPQVARSLLGVTLGVVAFVIAAGIDEYSIVAHGVKTVDAHRGERPLTTQEIWEDTIRAAKWSVPAAVLCCGVLFGITWPFSLICRLPWPLAPALAILGAIMGGALSIGAWAIVGGWGPAYLLPSLGAGAIIAPCAMVNNRERPNVGDVIVCPHCGRVNSIHTRLCPRCEREIG